MKPLKLTMRAFGSYSRETTIDFTKLSQNLFLVTGDTGAGKTTVFDAIVFALYGEASSVANKKDGVLLQSQYAPLDVTPYVRLEFSDGENGDIYVVSRTPRHLKLLTRGRGSGSRTTEKNASVSLLMPDGTEYPLRETQRKIEEIVGFNKEQFMQVAMIAQGEFMELLRAKSDAKKVIFRKLFHTDFYEKIVKELESRKRSKEKEIAEIKTASGAVAGRIKIPDDYGRKEQIAGLKEQIETGTLANMEEFLEELAVLCGYCQEVREESEKALKEASGERDKKRDACIAAENLLQFYSQLEQAKADLAECEKQKEEIEQGEKLAAVLAGAYDILTEYKAYEMSKKAADSIRAARKRKEEELPDLKQRAKILTEEKKEAEEQYDAAKERYGKLSERVEAAKKILREKERMEAEYEESLGELKTAGEELREEKKKLALFEEQEQGLKDQAETFGNAEVFLEKWKRKEKLAKDLSEDSEETKNLEKQIREQSERAVLAKREYEEAKETYLRESRRYEQSRQNFLDAQAGILAGSLKEGKPCPVCGSLEHPMPCRSDAEEELSREQLKQMSKAVEICLQKQEDAAARAKEEETALREKSFLLEKKFGKLEEQYREAVAGEESESEGRRDKKAMELEIHDLIEKFGKTVQEEGERLQKNVDDLQTIRKRLEEVRADKENLQELISKCLERLQKAENAVHQKRGNLESLSGAAEYASMEEADHLLEMEKERRDEIALHCQERQRKAQQAESEKREAETLLKGYREELPEKEREAEERKKSYEARMSEKDIGEAQWQELTAEYSREEIERLNRKAAEHHLKEQRAMAVKEAAMQAIGDRERPVLKKLEEDKRQAEEVLAVVKEQLDRHQERERDNKGVYEELAPRAKERSIILEEHRRLDGLYKLVSGNVTGARMDLETFVQRYYLEKVLHAANRRFQEMSAGQFELRMVSPERAGEGKNRGLDLMVYSAVIGKEREIRTLSGGESFMAALSLALGMADQIQESAEGIHLDIMFIDEGFGSLDEHSRNQAVKVLKEMAEGKRLIGIISHVTELKQEIEEKLVVSKNDEGSFVRWE